MFLMKICLIGDGAVGKTALRERYLGKGFAANYLMTIGADFAVQHMEVDGKQIKFQIWDLAGQERFGSVRSLYYSGSHGVLMVFDVTRDGTYHNLVQGWLPELQKHLRTGPVPIILLGNKIDLRSPDDASHIQADQGKKLAAELAEQYSGGDVEVHYLETSAKTGVNVIEAFTLLAQQIIKHAG
ncbi:MAG: GTP-binding protein [Candidatus Hodarchaeales archaeon]|jgi:small GTP-binding protein